MDMRNGDTEEQFMKAHSIALFEMKNKNILTDVYIQCIGGIIPAHRIILAGSSEFFHDFFNSKLNVDARLVSVDVKFLAMSTLLQFLYCGQLVLNWNNLDETENVLHGVHVLNLKEAYPALKASLKAVLSPENFQQIWDMVCKYDLEPLKNVVLSAIGNNIKTWSQLISLQTVDCSQIIQILSDTGLHEENKLLVLSTWVQENMHEREQQLRVKLSHDELPPHVIPMVKNFLSNLKQQNCPFNRSVSSYSLNQPRVIHDSMADFNKCNHLSDIHLDIDSFGFQHISRFSFQRLEPSQLDKEMMKSYLTSQEPHSGSIEDKDTSTVNESTETMLREEMAPALLIMGKNQRKRTVIHCLRCPDLDPITDMDFKQLTEKWCDSCLGRGVVWIQKENVIYALGGIKGLSVLNSVTGFDISNQSFRSFPRLKQARCFAGAVVCQNIIYVLGGMGPKRQVLNAVERLKNKWEVLSSMPNPVWEFGVASVNNHIYVMGGRCKRIWSVNCYAYNPQLDQWSCITDLPSEFSGCHPIIASDEQYIYAFKNFTTDSNTQVMCVFDPSICKWETNSTQGVITASRNPQAALYWNGKLYILENGVKLYIFDPKLSNWELELILDKSLWDVMHLALIWLKSNAKETPRLGS